MSGRILHPGSNPLGGAVGAGRLAMITELPQIGALVPGQHDARPGAY